MKLYEVRYSHLTKKNALIIPTAQNSFGPVLSISSTSVKCPRARTRFVVLRILLSRLEISTAEEEPAVSQTTIAVFDINHLEPFSELIFPVDSVYFKKKDQAFEFANMLAERIKFYQCLVDL